MEVDLRIDEQIRKSDKVICRHISNINHSTRGEMSQDILSQLRHFVEHIMLKIYANGNDIEDTQENVKKAVKYVKSESALRHISRFHHFLQVAVSHRTLEEENSERLMLKYYEYLLRIRNFLYKNYSMEVLHNLEEFPIETDESLNEYYEKIAEKVEHYNTPLRNGFRLDRFYVQKIKPFFYKNKIYYEVAFVPANDKASKTDRIIAFTDIEITDYYAVRLALADASIEIFNRQMPIRVIVDWEVSIRPCEYANFNRLVDNNGFQPSKIEQRNLTEYLTRTGISLSEIIMFPDEIYATIREQIVPKSQSRHFFDTLDICRTFVKMQKPGHNVLRYLLHHMTNRIIKAQYKEHWKWNYEECRREYVGGNFKLSNLYLAYECIPFDEMPFCSGLKNHVPRFSDLFAALDIVGREHEVLAWLIKNNTEQKGILFTPLEKCEVDGKYKLGNFDDVETLVRIYNRKLYDSPKQQARKLIIKNGYIFIESYKDDTVSIIQTIKSMTDRGIENYSNTVKHWVENQDYSNISDEKKTALINMFDKSEVYVIYGAVQIPVHLSTFSV